MLVNVSALFRDTSQYVYLISNSLAVNVTALLE